MLRTCAVSVQIWFQLRVKDFSLAYAALGSKVSEMEKNIYSCFYFVLKVLRCLAITEFSCDFVPVPILGISSIAEPIYTRFVQNAKLVSIKFLRHIIYLASKWTILIS